MSYIILDTSDPAEKRRLDALRARAKRAGLAICKARGSHHLNNRGGLMLVEAYRNVVLYGADYDLTLADAESLVAEVSKQMAA